MITKVFSDFRVFARILRQLASSTNPIYSRASSIWSLTCLQILTSIKFDWFTRNLSASYSLLTDISWFSLHSDQAEWRETLPWVCWEFDGAFTTFSDCAFFLKGMSAYCLFDGKFIVFLLALHDSYFLVYRLPVFKKSTCKGNATLSTTCTSDVTDVEPPTNQSRYEFRCFTFNPLFSGLLLKAIK